MPSLRRLKVEDVKTSFWVRAKPEDRNYPLLLLILWSSSTLLAYFYTVDSSSLAGKALAAAGLLLPVLGAVGIVGYCVTFLLFSFGLPLPRTIVESPLPIFTRSMKIFLLGLMVLLPIASTLAWLNTEQRLLAALIAWSATLAFALLPTPRKDEGVNL